jgi:hypothetical protein
MACIQWMAIHPHNRNQTPLLFVDSNCEVQEATNVQYRVVGILRFMYLRLGRLKSEQHV